jgi:hypothetical protein
MDRSELLTITTLTVVGSGSWATKLCQVITQNSKAFEVIQIPARDLLNRQSLDSEIVWVATLPNIQVLILERFGSEFKKVVIEKPLARDPLELRRLENAVTLISDRVYLSETWAHSELWKSSMQTIGVIKSISSQRFSGYRRSYMSPPQDWCGHDFSLLDTLNLSLPEGIQKTGLMDSEYCKITFQAGENICVQLEYGLQDKRISKWSVTNALGEIFEIDFGSSTLYKYDHDGNVSEIFKQRSTHHPIVDFLEFVETSACSTSFPSTFMNYRIILGD